MKTVIIAFILICTSQVLIGQSKDPLLNYLTEFHRKEAEYITQIGLDHPELSREELKELIREYYRENFHPPKLHFYNESANLKITQNQGIQMQDNTNFNQVPDDIEYLALKALFQSTNGPNWTSYDNWDYPNWKSSSTVTYADFEDWEGVSTLNGDVYRIDLEKNNLNGTLPVKLGDLLALEYLWLWGNSIYGSIPQSITNLSSLYFIFLNGNYISGLPPSLEGLDSLQYLELGGNNLYGNFPTQLADLPNINSLNLGGNELTGSIGSTLINYNLSSIYLQNNYLSGSLELFGPTGNNFIYTELYVEGNQYDFESLEFLFYGQGQPKGGGYGFRYSPQYTTLGHPQTLTFNENHPLIIPFSTGGEHNRYQWQKWNGSNWQDISGAGSAEYSKPNAELSDAGRYRCKVTNEWVTDLTLYSYEATVTIIGVPDPPISDSVHLCPGETATLTASGEGTIYWFSAATEGDTLATGASFTTPVLTESTTYYVSQEVDSIHSERIPVVALVGPVLTVSEDQSICMGNDITLSVQGENLAVNWGDFGNDPAIVVSPDTTTTYVYTVEDEFGCFVSDSITVTVLDSLIAEIIPPTAICPGESVTFEAVEVPGATYSWEPDGLSGRVITVQADEMQEYTLTVTNSNGCTATDSEFVPFAALATVSEDQTICVIDSVVLSAEGGDRYLWSTGDTTAQITFHPEAAGEYTLTVNVTTDSCTSSEDVVVTVEPHCPGTPVSFYARAISTSEITLQWQEPEGNQDQYVIQKRNAEGLYETVATIPKGNTAWDDTELEPDSLYYYRIFSQAVSAQSAKRLGSARTFRPNQNYIRETIVLVEGIKEAALVSSLPNHEQSSSWTYLNGLGSEMQTIMEAASPSGNDIVQPIIYDENGMVTKQYLPYSISQQEPGNFRKEAKQEVLDFYANPPPAVATSLFPYAVTLYGKSPQNKVIGQGAHGEAWQIGTGHSVTLTTATNSATDVLQWEYDEGTGVLVADAYYPKAQLTKAITINEDGEKTVVYTDMLGKKLKQEVYLTDEDIIVTYFVYNNKGSLLFKITPLVVDQVTSGESLPYTINQNIIQNLCYTYIYDEQERLIETQWADKEAVFYVYDQWDRLVLSQDGNQRQKNEWSFTKYDRYNRAILSGLYETAVPYSRIEMQTEVNNFYAQSTSRFESFGGNIHGYTNLSFPVVNDENAYLTITYFDDYTFMDEVDGFGPAYAFDASVLGCETVAPETEYCFPSAASRNTLGKVTGSKTKIINRDHWLSSVMYYDEKGRSIQAVTENYIGSIDRQSSLYNFPGWLLATYLSHHGADGKSRGIKRRYVYDHAGRLLEGYHELYDNDIGQGEVFLAENKYNELGQLIEKNLHIEQGAPIQSIDYRYNIRGWLKSINGTDLNVGQNINANDAKQDLFGMELIYNGVLNGVQNDD